MRNVPLLSENDEWHYELTRLFAHILVVKVFQDLDLSEDPLLELPVVTKDVEYLLNCHIRLQYLVRGGAVCVCMYAPYRRF